MAIAPALRRAFEFAIGSEALLIEPRISQLNEIGFSPNFDNFFSAIDAMWT